MDFSRLSTPQKVSAVSIVVVAVAAFLPWVSIFGISISGIRGDGALTLLLAVAGGVLLALQTGLVKGREKLPDNLSDKVIEIALVALAAVVALIGLLDMSGAAAIGLYLTLFGGIAWVVGAGWQLSTSRQSTTPPPAA